MSAHSRISRINGRQTKDYWRYPRGCAISWTVKYLSYCAPDSDSGPIIWGNGVAATAFGLEASQRMGDGLAYWQLRNAAALGDAGLWLAAFMQPQADLVRVSRDLLALSIRFSAVTVGRDETDD